MEGTITVKINLKYAKELIVKQKFKGRDGKDGEVDNIECQLIELKPESKKLIYDHELFQNIKTHFAVKPQTKEDRAAKAETVYVGEGITQVWKNKTPQAAPTKDAMPMDDLPF
jgi:hypothetical protein|tara:strand:- start:1510 stop:1848 length:339 start_codon:yes stop_codon:yes gene_type:complete